MCVGNLFQPKAPKPPPRMDPSPPLKPSAPPPAPPVKPPPEPENLEAREINPQVRRTKTSKELNPQVRRAKSKKSKNPYLQGGTGSLRIPLNPGVNTGTTSPTGGLNK